MKTKIQQNKKTWFGKLAIGDKFDCGKFYGAGIKSDVIMWEVLIKKTKSKAEVVETHGGFNTLGHTRHFHPANTVFIL